MKTEINYRSRIAGELQSQRILLKNLKNINCYDDEEFVYYNNKIEQTKAIIEVLEKLITKNKTKENRYV